MNNKQRKEYLFRLLGNRCKNCFSNLNLSFDHIQPRQYSIEHLTESQRLIRYIADAKQGLLQVLCIECNSRKSRIAVNKGFRNPKTNCNCNQCLQKKLNRKYKNKLINSNKLASTGTWSERKNKQDEKAAHFCSNDFRRGQR